MDPLAQPPPPQQQKKKKKSNQKKKKKKTKRQLQIEAINKQRACFRKWVYIRNRCYLAAAIGYTLYYLYNNYFLKDYGTVLATVANKTQQPGR